MGLYGVVACGVGDMVCSGTMWRGVVHCAGEVCVLWCGMVWHGVLNQ